MKRRKVILLLLLVAFMCPEALPRGQKPQPQGSSPTWYIPRGDRKRLYDEVRLSSGDGYHTIITGLWITPALAWAFVSATLDSRTPTAARSDDLYALVRPADKHLVVIRLNEIPAHAEHLKISTRLVIGKGEREVAGTVERVPFPMGGVVNDEPHARGFLAVYPRVDSTGRKVIESLDDDIKLIVQLPGQPVTIRVHARKLAAAVNEL